MSGTRKRGTLATRRHKPGGYKGKKSKYLGNCPGCNLILADCDVKSVRKVECPSCKEVFTRAQVMKNAKDYAATALIPKVRKGK